MNQDVTQVPLVGVADVNTVLIERAELHRLRAENDGVQALVAVHQRTLERCLDLKAKCAELEAQLYAIGAGGVGESIQPPVQADTVIPVSVPTGWKLVPVEPTDDMFIEGMDADLSGRPCLDDDKHVRSIWRAMLSSAPDAPQPPVQPDTAAQQEPVAWLVCSVNNDGSLKVEHAATWKEAAHEHINDAIVEYEVPGAGSWIVRPAYAAPQPASQPLPADTYTALAHRLATRFTYSTDRSFCEYYFAIHTLEQFVRAIEAAHGITGGQ